MGKFGNKIQGAGPAPLLREPAKDTLVEADPRVAEAAQEDADRLAAVAKREADEAEAERAEVARKAKEVEAERLAAETARLSTEREDAERKAAVAKREADEAEAERAEVARKAADSRKAKERLGVTPTVATSSSNPPPPENPAPKSHAATTEEVNEYVAGMNATDAEAAEKAKRASVVTIPPPAASAPPDPPQWVQGNPRVSMQAVTERSVRFRQNLPRIVIGVITGVFRAALVVAFGIAVAVGVGVYYGFNRTMPSLTARTESTHSATNAPTTIATVTAPNPEPTIPYGLLPPGAEPGLLGVPGTRVRMSARAAFPTRCASALTANWSDDIRFLCGRDQRRGNNLCNCDVTGLVP